MPEVVSTSSDSFKTVSYQNIAAVIVEAIKQQQKIINQQKAELQQLREDHKTELDQVHGQLQEMKALLEKLSSATSTSPVNK
ncbi:MAG: hypothetical protein AB1489_19185 [Acidobacteriota bacterium]